MIAVTKETVAGAPSVTPATVEDAGFGSRPYAIYALLLLTAANFFNYLDRNIVSILAETLKADLGLTDAQVGFLFGTAFSVLFAVVGIPVGRISDRVRRTGLLALGLVIWSAMTVASGLAATFLVLAIARIGVGLGEATANPCSHSLLSDYFPRRNRATAMGLYLVATYVGGGCALFIGGLFLDHWASACAAASLGGLCGLKGWQAAFFVAGLPGLILSILVYRLREPPRRIDGAVPLASVVATEFASSTPPLTLFSAFRHGGSGGLLRNAILLSAVVGAATGMAILTGDVFQWSAVGLGAYALGSWIQGVARRDPAFFKLTFACPTFLLALAGMSSAAIIGGTVQFWATPHALRSLGLSASEAGLQIGGVVALGSVFGVALGGWATDVWKRRDPRAPMWIALCGLVGAIPFSFIMFLTREPPVFFGAFFVQAIMAHVWAGGAAAFVQDMVIQRMRGAASAGFSLVIIMTTLALGPYWAGRISTATGSLATGIFSVHLLAPPAALALVLAARRMRRESLTSRLAMARAAGEPA